MKKLLFILVTILILSSCSTFRHNLRSDANIETLSICINYDPAVPPEIQEEFDNALVSVIQDFNSAKHAFILAPCGDSETSTFNIKVFGTKFVTPEQHVLSAIVTVAGIATVVLLANSDAPFYITFWYAPQTSSEMDVWLSPDITTTPNPQLLFLKSGAFFKSQPSQVYSQGEVMQRFLANEVNVLEREYRKLKD